MRLRTRLVAIVAAFMQATAPFAAYAIATPGPGFDDVCSAAKPQKQGPAQTPANAPVDRHGLSHCAVCAGGSASAVLPAPPLPVVAPVALASSRIATTVLFAPHDSVFRPRARGPPLLA